jgi:hypothetical protein
VSLPIFEFKNWCSISDVAAREPGMSAVATKKSIRAEEIWHHGV